MCQPCSVDPANSSTAFLQGPSSIELASVYSVHDQTCVCLEQNTPQGYMGQRTLKLLSLGFIPPEVASAPNLTDISETRESRCRMAEFQSHQGVAHAKVVSVQSAKPLTSRLSSEQPATFRGSFSQDFVLFFFFFGSRCSSQPHPSSRVSERQRGRPSKHHQDPAGEQTGTRPESITGGPIGPVSLFRFTLPPACALLTLHHHTDNAVWDILFFWFVSSKQLHKRWAWTSH